MIRLDLTIAFGSIEHVNTRAVVLGVYRNVDPDGPAAVLDRALGGAWHQVVERRMFSAEAGTLFMLPAARSGLRTDFVLLAGLGAFDQFRPEVLQMVGANVVRTLLCSHVDDFATVVIGAGSGLPPRDCLAHLLTGFVSAYDGRNAAERLQHVTFCEIDRRRHKAMVTDARRVARKLGARHHVDVTVRDTIIDAPPTAAHVAAPRRAKSPVYLLVRQEPRRGGKLVLSSGVLTAGPRAAIATERLQVSKEKLDAHLRALEQREFTPRELITAGKTLAKLVLPSTIQHELSRLRGHHLAVVHDSEASRIPWEVLRIGPRTPALDAGTSRRYTATNLSIARWAEPRRSSRDLRMLLIENPTGDLQQAAEEAERIRQLAKAHERMHVTTLQGRRATRHAVLDALRSERFDVLHYAGHARFVEDSPSRSGLGCADGPLTADHLFDLRSLPALLFFNACETARLSQTVGIAETLLRAGVANYVGTYWPVADRSARVFGSMFYRRLLSGDSVAKALLAARRVVHARKTKDAIDWADYIHYGDPDFRIKNYVD